MEHVNLLSNHQQGQALMNVCFTVHVLVKVSLKVSFAFKDSALFRQGKPPKVGRIRNKKT